ncbi:MAG: RlmE family RNA methyltransferase [Bdellovibrionaceae bacterium]|nr:RlmE family RNA methyltransferase [Pseudobdellovibrionaceae bacterium]NUM58287.1 RlmE family RNA methyltransferase [Pseudobdellovibrionaceae bacterium]
MNYNPRDHYFKKAKKENFVARSIYKLEEIDKKFNLIKKDHIIVDLGASPGSWSQYCLSKLGDRGKIIGIDLNPVTFKNPKYIFYQQDIFEVDWNQIKNESEIDKIDIVLSDMAPKTTGIKFTDQARSLDLCLKALEVSDLFLSPKGHFVCKFFHSDDYKVLVSEMKKKFTQVEALKPDSTRKISKEIFLIGINKK